MRLLRLAKIVRIGLTYGLDELILEHEPTGKISFEDLGRSLGIKNVFVTDPSRDTAPFEQLLKDCLTNNQLNLIILRRPCLLIAGKIKGYERAAGQGCSPVKAE